MKHRLALCALALLLCAAFLGGCKKSESGSTPSSSLSTSATSAVAPPAATPSATAASGGEGTPSNGADNTTAGTDASAAGATATGEAGSAPAAALPAAPLPEGDFWNPNEARYIDERAPRLALGADGAFVFTANLGDGRLGALTGSGTRSGNTLTLQVEGQDSEDYLGDTLTSLTFAVTDDDHMRYTGEPLGMTRSGDQFTRDGVDPLPDTPASAAAPAQQSQLTPEGAAGTSFAASMPASASAAVPDSVPAASVSEPPASDVSQPEAEQAPTGLFGLPLWATLAAGGGLLAVVAVVVILLLRRRRGNKENTAKKEKNGKRPKPAKKPKKGKK